MKNFKYFILFFISVLFVFSSSFTQEISSAELALQIGDTAPSFQANDDQGNLWRYSDQMSNKYLVIYFYPAAMTGG
jgi:thioredoxin-dependent peroxiredoxin